MSFAEFLAEEKKQLLEASMSRVHAHTQDRNIGIITAHRGEYDAAYNKKRNEALKADIRAHGLGFIKVKGRYIENHGTPEAKPVDEHSFLVVGKKGEDNGHLKGFLTKHGKKYGQDSVLYKPHNKENAHLIGTKEGGFPGAGKTHDVGKWHPNRAPEFHSVMKGKTFAFESVEYVNEPSWFSRKETLF